MSSDILFVILSGFLSDICWFNLPFYVAQCSDPARPIELASGGDVCLTWQVGKTHHHKINIGSTIFSWHVNWHVDGEIVWWHLSLQTSIWSGEFHLNPCDMKSVIHSATLFDIGSTMIRLHWHLKPGAWNMPEMCTKKRRTKEKKDWLLADSKSRDLHLTGGRKNHWGQFGQEMCIEGIKMRGPSAPYDKSHSAKISPLARLQSSTPRLFCLPDYGQLITFLWVIWVRESRLLFHT